MYLKIKFAYWIPETKLKVVKKLRKIVETEFSDYAGFHFEVKPGDEYHHSFIING